MPTKGIPTGSKSTTLTIDPETGVPIFTPYVWDTLQNKYIPQNALPANHADGGQLVHVVNTADFPAGGGGGSGGLTDTQLRASPVPVSVPGTLDIADRAGRIVGHVVVDSLPSVAVNNFPATQPVSGTFWQATQPVSGPLTDTQLRAAAVPVSGSVGVNNFPSGFQVIGNVEVMNDVGNPLPVSGTFWQATQPVSGPLTDTQLRATAVPVSGPLTDTQLRATAVPVSGPLTDTQLRASAVPTAPIDKAAVSAGVIGNVSLGTSSFKTNKLLTGSLASVAVTADQVILTYTVTAGKTFYLQYILISARLTTFAATATFFGTVSLESPAATKLFTVDLAGTGGITYPELEFAEPIPIAAGTVIRLVCTPSAVTPFTWRGNFGGYEK